MARGAKQVFEQLALPGVPHLRTGAANVGNCEQVQRDQITFTLDQRGEAFNRFGVGQILFLRHCRHREMFLDQEYDQSGIFAADAVLAAKAPRVAHAQFAVVAATAFGDVVKQGGDKNQPVAFEIGHQARAQRVLVRVFQHGEAAGVAHYLQNVLIDRVDVKQVVLHLPDDAFERRNHTA